MNTRTAFYRRWKRNRAANINKFGSIAIVIGCAIYSSPHLGPGTTAIAGELSFLLMSEAYQDAVMIGEVQARNGGELRFQPVQDLLPQRSLTDKPIPKEIRVQANSPEDIQYLQAGDAVVFPLTEKGGRYFLTGKTAFKVNSTDPCIAKIISGPLFGAERFYFQRFINSCGSERSFFFDGKTIFLRSPNQSRQQNLSNIPIGVKDGDRYLELETHPSVCSPVKISLWTQIKDVFLQKILSFQPGRNNSRHQ